MERLLEALKQYWGYDTFLPLQKEAMECVINNKDSVVILSTGGGKSLCFQAPALCMDGLAVIVSPLISLMKDQVDSLINNGVSAAFINSSLSYEERRQVVNNIKQNKIKLLYVAPERLVLDTSIKFLKQINLSFIAIDEAHCISHWGHDFRPEYRELKILRKAFPNIAIHAYTATATDHVRNDIAQELFLNNPQMIIGSFDRPNLIYSATKRIRVLDQICAVIDRYPSESGIIYCIRRSDVDNLSDTLTRNGYKALPYHAGMTNEDRKKNQEAFIQDKTDIIVATVAFGMGIDKSNVRYVIHSGMPKSLEHYQQETGRSGRDGLNAECCLFYSEGDLAIWRSVFREMESQFLNIALGKLDEMYSYCVSGTCKHKAILAYFGQELENENCGACDICLEQVEQGEILEDSLQISQKILSCISDLKGNFGSAYVGRVLVGSEDKRIKQFHHDKLIHWGILAKENRQNIGDWIGQLAEQGYIQKTEKYDERIGRNYTIISITDKGLIEPREIPRLVKPATRTKERVGKIRKQLDSWNDSDLELFQVLRALRLKKADEQRIPAFIVFGDATLWDMVRRKPLSLKDFLDVNGVGAKKCETYGNEFVQAIKDYCVK
jgi:ATP-dependent DNA helicase RecQ